ncbi:MAG: RNA methyltransferase [Myxococcaceae bacterium]
MPLLRDRLVVVCHQIRSADNLGAIARLMANFGLPELRLSDPLTYALRDADKLAIKGARILDGMKVCRSLDEALEDCTFACGTTSRTEVKGRVTCAPVVAIDSLSDRAPEGKVALVFGGEKRGLSDDELQRCHEVLVIPTTLEQPSMNLAQSAAVLFYLCSRVSTPTLTDQPPAAPLQLVQVLEEKMREVLLAKGFLNPQAPDHVLTEMSRSLIKGRLTQREAELWVAAFKKLARP